MDQQTHEAKHHDFLDRVSRALSEQMGFPVTVTWTEYSLILTGTANSDAARDEAQATLRELAPGTDIVNQLSVDDEQRQRARDSYADHNRLGDLRPPAGSESLELAGSDLEPSFENQPLETNPINVADESVADLDVPAEPDETYFAPTDPVVGTDVAGGPEVVGGFDATSMEDDAVDRSTIDGQPGDEAIADAVRRELHEDAETIGLTLDVVVENGVVHLRGRVADLTDAEDAEEVANRVPGVRDVIDETQIATF